jgi:hypothetical protein
MMRSRCHWLAIGLAALITVSALAITCLWPTSGRALATGTSCSLARDGYQGPECCAGCHPAEHEGWSHTAHAVAGVDPAFQVRVQQEADPAACYCCHTTGYDQGTGRYALPGVTCERCHAAYHQEHSAATMAVASPIELCGGCHAHTLAAWHAGDHGEADQACTDCHTVHTHG